MKRRLCALRRIHNLCDLGDPTQSEDVQLAMRRVRRAQPSRPKQAHGVTASLRDQLLAVCGDDLIGLRDKVLVRVGFDTLCRRGSSSPSQSKISAQQPTAVIRSWFAEPRMILRAPDARLNCPKRPATFSANG